MQFWRLRACEGTKCACRHTSVWCWTCSNAWSEQEQTDSTWSQIFALFWMLYSLFRVIPWRLNFICRRFGTLCLIFSSYLHHLWRWNRQSVPKRRHIKFRRRGITRKKEYNNIFLIYYVWKATIECSETADTLMCSVGTAIGRKYRVEESYKQLQTCRT